MGKFTLEEAVATAGKLSIDFDKMGFTAEEFLEGMNIELEHGTIDPETNVTQDNAVTTAKIAFAHLKENKLYYDDNVGLEAWEHALDEIKGDTTGKKVVII